jgi:hypothetical protein
MVRKNELRRIKLEYMGSTPRRRKVKQVSKGRCNTLGQIENRENETKHWPAGMEFSLSKRTEKVSWVSPNHLNSQKLEVYHNRHTVLNSWRTHPGYQDKAKGA